MIEYWVAKIFVSTMVWGLILGLNVLVWWAIIERVWDEIKMRRKK